MESVQNGAAHDAGAAQCDVNGRRGKERRDFRVGVEGAESGHALIDR
jgi:hypothetical protein